MKVAGRRSQVAAVAATLVSFVAAVAHAQIVATTPHGVAVAHDGRVELYDDRTIQPIWSVSTVSSPSTVATGDKRLAVLDAFDNQIALIDLDTGRAELLPSRETPLAGVFIGDSLFVLERDARLLERIGAGGDRVSVALAADPAFLRQANGFLYVYSRVAGVVQEISPRTMTVTRTLDVAPFGSDFETDGNTGYVVLPRQAKVSTFSLTTMRATGAIAAGVVPVDLTVTRKGGALSAAILSVADPSAKRVWITEGTQSVTAAVARGFIRGLLGLGLFAPHNADFPSGVDRIFARGSTAIAYDSAMRTLYRLHGSKGSLLARDLGPGAFAAGTEGIFVWQSGRLQLIR